MGCHRKSHTKIFEPKSHPGALPRWKNENLVQYVSYFLFVRTNTKFGIEIFDIDFAVENK